MNVLAACGFDLRFHHLTIGWEGSAHDQRVLNETITDGNFKVPEGRYYLADAGYSNTTNTLTPYRGVRYHLREWLQATAAQKPARNRKEHYNFRHSQARNVVERIFGCLKRKFQILACAEVGVKKTSQLVIACTALWNVLRMYKDGE